MSAFYVISVFFLFFVYSIFAEGNMCTEEGEYYNVSHNGDELNCDGVKVRRNKVYPIRHELYGCFCKEGHRLYLQEKCITTAQCAEIKQNKDMCKHDNTTEFSAIMCEDKCGYQNYCNIHAKLNIGCVCKKGYKRHNNKCITISECNNVDKIFCESQGYGYNEIPLTHSCDTKYSTINFNPRGCVCNDNQAYENNQCIPKSECPRINENICKEKRMDYTNDTTLLDRNCEGNYVNRINGRGCICKNGYRRAEGGCILESKCAEQNVECERKINNSYYKGLVITTEQNCRDNQTVVALLNSCGCKKDFYRYKDVCISVDNCKDIFEKCISNHQSEYCLKEMAIETKENIIKNHDIFDFAPFPLF